MHLLSTLERVRFCPLFQPILFWTDETKIPDDATKPLTVVIKNLVDYSANKLRGVTVVDQLKVVTKLPHKVHDTTWNNKKTRLKLIAKPT
jgi:uncharacterized phage-associated protein